MTTLTMASDAQNQHKLSVHVDPEATRRMSISQPALPALAAEAQKATDSEHKLGLWQSLKLYPKAAAWSIFLSTAVVMEGFDKALIPSLFAFPEFQKKFGVAQADGSYELTAEWQAALTNGALVGEILGLMLNGIIAERFGYRKTMIGGLLMTVAFIFIIFFSETLVQLLIGEILIGIPWGIFQTITVTYASEVAPTHMRAYLTTYVNLCWVIGQFISSGVLRGFVNQTGQWAYKIPLGLQWMWPVPLIVGIYFAPESPWWLIRRDRDEEAKRALLRLTSRNSSVTTGFNADETISMMKHTNELEKAASGNNGGTSYLDCFRGTDLRRTEVVCGAWIVQTLCGSTFMGYSALFYQRAGMAVEDSFSMSMGQYAIGAVGVLFSWMLMGWFGRRTLYLAGQAAMVVLLLGIGFTALAGRENVAAQWAIGSMLLVYTFVYDSTVGPVCYSLVSELPSTRLKTKTVVLARNLYNITGLSTNILTPRMLNPTAWNWGAKSGFFWAGSCFLCFVWTYFRLPEPKGRTYGELDVLFEQRVSARKFKTTVVEDLDAGEGKEVEEENEKKANPEVTMLEVQRSGSTGV